MEAQSNHSRQGQPQPPVMVDIATGEEYLNGELIPEEPPLEVVLFKFRKNHEASLPPDYLGDSRCDLNECFCDVSSVRENAQEFCVALRKIAECRGRMCPFTITELLKDEIFNVLFEWLEMGDDWDPNEGHGENTNTGNIPNNNPHHDTSHSSSSSNSDHSNERLPQEEVLINELSPISSTTSPPAPSGTENEDRPTPNSAETRSPSNNTSSVFAWAGLRLKNPALELVRRMDVDEDSTSSEPEISQVHNESRESDENTSAVEPVSQSVATEISPELPSTTEEDGIQISGMNQANQNPEQSVNEEPEPETQENETSSHQIDDSSSPPECPTISDFDAHAAAVAVPNIPDANSAGDAPSANLSSLQSDNNADHTDNDSVPCGPVIEKVVEPPNAPKSNSDDLQSDNNLITKTKSVLKMQKPIKAPANETDSQPPEIILRWADGFIASTTPQRKSSFDSSGDSARVRELLGLQYTSSVNISDVQQNDEQSPASDVETGSESEELEDGEIDSQEDAQQVEAPKQTEAPVDKTMKTTVNNDKRITRSGTNSPVPFQSDEGVRTRSRSSVPGPASVKRDRASRAAKTSAQSKISSLLGVAAEADTDEASNAAKDSTVPTAASSPATGLRKRLRNSESVVNQSDETPSQHQTRSTVNKSNLSRKRAKILPDETSSDVPSSSSRSSTPTMDESYHHPETRSRQERRNSSSPVATRQSQRVTKVLEEPQTKTSNDKTSTEEQMITNAEDSGSSESDDSSSSDSGESHVSEIPLAERLEKKRKREDKERRKALKGKTSDEARSHKSERKRKKKQGLSLNLAKSESSSTLQSKLPFRIPDLPTTAKKAEALKSSTPSILQAAKSQNLLQQQHRVEVETTTEKVVTINDDEDDDILMIQEVEVPKKTTSTGAKSAVRRSNSTEGGTSTGTPKLSGIHISLSKDKTKGLTPQRSLSIPGTSPTNTPDNTLISPGATRIEFGKSPLAKSTSLPLPLATPDELNITPSSEVDLEDHSRWEFPQNISPRKTPQISLGSMNSKTNESIQHDKSKSQPAMLDKIQSITYQSSPDKPVIIINGKESTASKEPIVSLSASKKSTDIPSTSQKSADVPSTSKKPTEIPSTSKKPAEIPSTIKKPTETPSTSKKPTETPPTSKDPKPASSLPNKVPTSIPSSPNQKGGSENIKQVSPSKNTTDDQASRNLRARKPFDPKAEAAKPIPKPVPKVTKEIIQQQQVSKSVPGPVPSSSISKTATVTSSASSTPQKEVSSLPSKNKESTTPQKIPEKSQQQDKHGRISESSARKETGESTSMSKVTSSAQQRERSRSPQITPKSNPPSMSATFADGEIRLLPNKPSTSNTSPTSGASGTWRRGGTNDNRREQEVDFTDDSVDFETRPDNEEDRRRPSSRDRDRNRNRSGASSRSSSSSSGGGNRGFRGGVGGHQQPYHFSGPPRGEGGGGPPRQFYDGGGRGHPRSRPPFSGGPRRNYGEESRTRSKDSEKHEWGRDRRRDNDYRRDKY